MPSTSLFSRSGASATGPGPIDVLCWIGEGLSFVHIDRCLFSLAYQAYRSLCITIVADRETLSQVEQLVDRLDWSGFPRRPVVLAFPDGMTREDARLAFAVRQAEQRFVALLNMQGTLYTRAYQLLADEARRSRAALVYGDAVIKSVRMHDGFIYEVKRDYRRAADDGKTELRSLTPLPLGACLLDRDRIARADLEADPPAGDSGEEALVVRLLSRYPSRHVEDRVPIFASHQDIDTRDDKPGPWHAYEHRLGMDAFRRSLRDLRRRLTAPR